MEEVFVERPIPTGEGLTFEKVWAMMQENDRKAHEARLETERMFKESKLEMDKMFKETDRISKRNSRKVGELSNKFGKLAEHLVAPGIVKRFKEQGIDFAWAWRRGLEVKDKTGKTLTQIDFVLENAEIILAVEVKADPVEKDVGHHIKRLEILRESMNELKENQRKIQGAIAGAIFEDSVKEAASNAGFYVIEQSGDTMKLDIPDGWQPKEW
jgi:hypothetical protein